jgi:ATP-dependent helicase/nuclease subunit B
MALAVRRWIEQQTFSAESGSAGVHFVDDQAARFGEFDHIALVGLIENEWPERSPRNIFYSRSLLKILGWPTEKDRRAAADARFLDLLGSAARRVAVSTIVLDDEAPVMRSGQLDEIPRARLSTMADHDDARGGTPANEAIAHASPLPGPQDAEGAGWAAFRQERPPASSPEFHGRIGSHDLRIWSVSALETYLGCPFRFFAQHILRLEEEPDDEEVMDPRRQGKLLHDVFETFFAEWQAGGRGAITPGNLKEAHEAFTAVVDRVLLDLPDAEAGLERTRLLGSSVAAGLGEAVLRMEAERPVPVVERMLEYPLEGAFSIATAAGLRTITLRGRADRLDLLEDGTFRLIDYKLGRPPERSRALQLPIYGVCAEQTLTKDRGRVWTLGEALYLAFQGPKRVVPVFSSGAPRDEVLADAQQRLADTLDAIGRGDFPPIPDDVHRCDTCRFAPVCRKDYVDDL